MSETKLTTSPAEEFPLLRDKLALWTSLNRPGSEFPEYQERAADELRRALKLIEDMREALIECEDYFDGKADADCEGDPLEFVPNREMRLLNTVQAVLPKLPSPTPEG